jgi:hypothetical protein
MSICEVGGIGFFHTRNQCCDEYKINKCDTTVCDFMEAGLLVQPWIHARTTMDCCRLCYQNRATSGFLECKRAHLGGFNSLLAMLRIESKSELGDMLKRLEDAKETCLASVNPDARCYEKMQSALQETQLLYDQMIDDYKLRYSVIATRPSSAPPM